MSDTPWLDDAVVVDGKPREQNDPSKPWLAGARYAGLISFNEFTFWRGMSCRITDTQLFFQSFTEGERKSCATRFSDMGLPWLLSVLWLARCATAKTAWRRR